MNPVKRFLILCFLPLAFAGCNENNKPLMTNEPNPDSLKEALLNANKTIIGTEDEQIQNLIERYGWKMKETGTGLRYVVYHQGGGLKAGKGMTVRLNYELRLITGDLVYSSKENGQKIFVIGKGGVESGLEEGILLLKVGDRAKLIIPSYLAFGLIGDQDKIPPKSTLIYDLEVIELKDNKVKTK